MKATSLSVLLTIANAEKLKRGPLIDVTHFSDEAACDALNEITHYYSPYYFNEDACTCFYDLSEGGCNANCGHLKPYGMHIQNPLVACECITIAEYASIFDHGRDDECLPLVHVDENDDDDYGHGANVNVFNFYGPLYGNINGYKGLL